jgi:hypothetical protein
MSAAAALSDEQIIEVQGELAAGRPVTVWFTEAAVGVPVGGSAKAIAIGDPAAGDFVQVRPTGSRDELFCSPSELTRNRPPRRKAAAAAKVAAQPTAAQPTEAQPTEAQPTEAQPTAAEPAVPRPRTATAESPAPRAAKEKPQPPAPTARPAPTAEVAAPSTAEKPRPAARRAAARADAGPELTFVLQPTSSGEWVASVTRGSKTVVRPTPVPPGDVAKAARCLPPAVGEAVDAALAAARTRQQERVAALAAELEAARQALEDLGG